MIIAVIKMIILNYNRTHYWQQCYAKFKAEALCYKTFESYTVRKKLGRGRGAGQKGDLQHCPHNLSIVHIRLRRVT